MARKRMIDPTIWADEDFGTLTPEAQIMFIGMFSNADDEGRLPGNALFLASTIMPYKGLTKDQATALRDEVLQQMQSIILYEVEGKEYLQFKKWSSYQSINKPTGSKYPLLPEDYSSDTVTLPPNRIEKKGIEKNRIESGAALPEKNTPGNLGDALKAKYNFQPPQKQTTGITKEWQEKAFRYAKDLGIELSEEDKGRWLHIFKQAAEGRKPLNLESAYSYCKDHSNWFEMPNEGRMNLFFKIYENGLTSGGQGYG